MMVETGLRIAVIGDEVDLRHRGYSAQAAKKFRLFRGEAKLQHERISVASKTRPQSMEDQINFYSAQLDLI